MVDGIAELEGALSRCQNDLSNLADQFRAATQYLHRVSLRVRRTFGDGDGDGDGGGGGGGSAPDETLDPGLATWNAQAEVLNEDITVACAWGTCAKLYPAACGAVPTARLCRAEGKGGGGWGAVCAKPFGASLRTDA